MSAKNSVPGEIAVNRAADPRRCCIAVIRLWHNRSSYGTQSRRRRRQVMTPAMFFKRSVVFVGFVMALGALATSISATPQDNRTGSNYTVRTLALPDNATGD